jgi:hypothetical protein
MLERYACEYCCKVYKTRKQALVCEERAERKESKFKVGQTVYDADGYEYKILNVEIWKKNFDKACKEQLQGIEGGNEWLEIPKGHSFLYTVEAKDPEYKNENFLSDPTPDVSVMIAFSKLKIPIDTKKKGITIKAEYQLFKSRINSKDS